MIIGSVLDVSLCIFKMKGKKKKRKN